MAQTSAQMERFWKAAQIKIAQHQCAAISSIMTPNVITLSPTSRLQEALVVFRTHRLRHLVVADEHNQVRGIFTKRDMISVEGGGLNRPITTVANEHVHVVQRTACIRSVAEMMLEHKIGCVPVVETQGAKEVLVGIVTESDFVRAFALSTRCNCGAMND